MTVPDLQKSTLGTRLLIGMLSLLVLFICDYVAYRLLIDENAAFVAEGGYCEPSYKWDLLDDFSDQSPNLGRLLLTPAFWADRVVRPAYWRFWDED